MLKDNHILKKYIKLRQKKNQIVKQNIDGLKEKDREIEMRDSFARSFYLAELPNILSNNLFLNILNLPFNFSFSFYLSPNSKSSILRLARQRKSVLESIQSEREEKGKSNKVEIEKEIEELNTFINDLVYETEKSFEISIFSLIFEKQKEELIKKSVEFQQLGLDNDFVFNTLTFEQKKGLLVNNILGSNLLNYTNIVQTSALTKILPITGKEYLDNTGIYLGRNSLSGGLIIKDLFKSRNANITILGTSGSGKSVTARTLIYRFFMVGINNIILDPEGEYSNITNSLGGNVYKFTKEKGINIFSVLKNGENSIIYLKIFFSFFVPQEKLDSSILDSVLKKYINDNTKYSLEDFLKVLRKESPIMSNYLDILLTGSLEGIFNGKEMISFNYPVVCFDLSSLKSDEVKLPAMYIIASMIGESISLNDGRKMIIIDEAHKLLANEQTTSFYIDLVKTARKRKCGVVTITQNPEDFKEENNAKTILTQSETTFLLKQSFASIYFLEEYKVFPLSEEELTELHLISIGQAILISENQHIFLDILPFDNEKKLLF